MLEANFTNEAVNVFQYIEDKLIKEFPSGNITIDYFLLSVLENEDSIGYQILSKTTLTSTLNTVHNWIRQNIGKISSGVNNGSLTYDTIFNKAIDYSKKELNTIDITSGHILISLLKLNDNISKQFSQIGITYGQLLTILNSVLPQKDSRKDNKFTVKMLPPKGPVEDLLVDMNYMASKGKIDEVIGNEEVINEIFTILAKRDRNNVVVVGEPGIGKTATVSHIANLLNSGNVPNAFKNKKLMKLDFTTLVSGAVLRGNFEARFSAIVDDATKKNGYIFFVDDIQSILSEKSKLAEINTENLLDMILMERNIGFICTMDEKSYNTYIYNNPSFKRRFQKVKMKEKDDKAIKRILKHAKYKFEIFHHVIYTDEAIDTCVELSKKYVKNCKLPDYAFNIMDEAAAKKVLNIVNDKRITEVEEKIENVKQKILEINNSTDRQDYSEYDKLKNEEIHLKSELSLIEKENILNNKPMVINENDIRELLSIKLDIPVTKISETEFDRLRTLSSRLKSYIVGQNTAVDEVCRVVKRQRVGISNSKKPAVLFFSGMSGTGKTYLAKKLAQEVFGDEKSMIRLDMSEYSDKMSVNKLYGASAGYIGYDNGGILTESVKKNNHCVLLLDEMEKANEDVHNVFLQLFDEGRLTDNMGNIVDFSNVIIIMTSNIGVKEISAKGGGIGFVRNNDIDNKEIIEKAMKNKFKPEFINRIDTIVHFNKLTEENLKEIIKLEINKVGEKLKLIKFKLGDTFISENCISYIYDIIKEKSEYGARPIIYTLQHEFEDKITDYIIEKQPEEGFEFQLSDIGLEKIGQ